MSRTRNRRNTCVTCVHVFPFRPVLNMVYCRNTKVKIAVSCNGTSTTTWLPDPHRRRLSLYGHPLLWIETYKCHRSRTFKVKSNTMAHTFRAKELGKCWRIHLFQLHAIESLRFLRSAHSAMSIVATAEAHFLYCPCMGSHDHHVLIWKLNFRRIGYTFFAHCYPLAAFP